MRWARSSAVCTFLIGLACATVASGDADGPDFWRVSGVASDSSLAVRASPDRTGRKLGSLPSNARGIRNLGCSGGASLDEWTAMSSDARAAARRSRWCRIRLGSLEGWVAGWFLREDSGPES